MNVTLYQICYNDDTCKRCKVQRIDNRLRTEPYPTLESRTIVDEFNNVEPCDYVGFLSWKFEMKRPILIENIYKRMQDDNYQHDVYSFFGGFGTSHRIWQKAENWHKGIIEIGQMAFDKAGIPVNLNALPYCPVIYQNAHVTRYDIYKEFVDTWLRPLVNVLENDPELHPLLIGRAPYKVSNNDNNTPEQLMRSMGQPHYTMHPFVAERIFSTYLHYNPKTVKHFC